MAHLRDIYYRKLVENEKNILFWEDYLKNLKSLDFNLFAAKLKVPVLVPVGSRIFFRGELKHTNEITVALGADYFVKCSLKQAEVLRQHRITDAQSKLNTFKKEKEYLENQLSFKNQLFEDQGQEIIEEYKEEEDKTWREKHRENVKKYKQNQTKGNTMDVTDEKLWARLEELELQEELENELMEMKHEDNDNDVEEPFVIKSEDIISEKTITSKEKEQDDLEKLETFKNMKDELMKNEKSTNASSKHDLLQKVLDKQNELEEKLLELRNKDRGRSKTETDLISKLDEMEELDELEDEMDRLDDILQTDKNEESEEENTQTSPQTKVKRSVSFADEDESETLQLTFTHSDIKPTKMPYDPVKGIQKPSDIYEAYSTSFSGATSILKKTKYEKDKKHTEISNMQRKQKSVGFQEDQDEEDNKTESIVVRDIVEKTDKSNIKLKDGGARPTSLFKQRRQQMKP